MSHAYQMIIAKIAPRQGLCMSVSVTCQKSLKSLYIRTVTCLGDIQHSKGLAKCYNDLVYCTLN